MKTKDVLRARGGLGAAAIGIFTVGLLSLFLPNAAASSCWGRLASSGFDGERIRTTLFFAGQANDGSTPYGCFIGPNVDAYTLHPAPRDLHLNWTNAANREVVMDLMVNAKINVISMSSWGEDFLPCTDGWVTGAAPMQTSPQAHDELFSAAVNKPLLIIPFIESRSTWSMRDEFPVWSDGRVSPGLVSQMVNLIERYLQNPNHLEWSNVWAKVYDHNGAARHAVVLIHAASNNLSPLDHEPFAAGFDLVADEVARRTGIRVGFFIDAVPPDSTLPRASFKAFAPITGPSLRNTASLLGIQCFAPEIFTAEHGDDDLLAWKREFIRGWFLTGIPVLVDVSPGYDGHIVFGDEAKGTYGYSDEWIQGLTALVNDYGRAGMVYNSWNGYTEGMVGTTTVEEGNRFYNWLTALNSNQGLHVDRNFTGAGKGTLSEPFPTIAAAIAEACEGDVIRIGRGNYPESLTISKRLRLEAENGSVKVGVF